MRPEDEDQTWNALQEFRDRRLHHEAARKYTVVVNGVEHNAGEYRDSTADILEELSDAHNIAMIGLRRFVTETPDSPWLVTVTGEYAALIRGVEHLMQRTMRIRRLLDAALVRDQDEVLGEKAPQRIVTLAEVGLD